MSCRVVAPGVDVPRVVVLGVVALGVDVPRVVVPGVVVLEPFQYPGSRMRGNALDKNILVLRNYWAFINELVLSSPLFPPQYIQRGEASTCMNRFIRTVIGTLCKSYCILCGHTRHCGCYFYRGGLSHCGLTNYLGRWCALWACQLALTRPIVTTVTGSSITPPNPLSPPPLTLCHPPPPNPLAGGGGWWRGGGPKNGVW